MVTSTPGDENIVNTGASVVINDDISKCSIEEDVIHFLKKY